MIKNIKIADDAYWENILFSKYNTCDKLIIFYTYKDRFENEDANLLHCMSTLYTFL